MSIDDLTWRELSKPSSPSGLAASLAGQAVASIKLGISPAEFQLWPRWQRKLALLVLALKNRVTDTHRRESHDGLARW